MFLTARLAEKNNPTIINYCFETRHNFFLVIMTQEDILYNYWHIYFPQYQYNMANGDGNGKKL